MKKYIIIKDSLKVYAPVCSVDDVEIAETVMKLLNDNAEREQSSDKYYLYQRI